MGAINQLHSRSSRCQASSVRCASATFSLFSQGSKVLCHHIISSGYSANRSMLLWALNILRVRSSRKIHELLVMRERSTDRDGTREAFNHTSRKLPAIARHAWHLHRCCNLPAKTKKAMLRPPPHQQKRCKSYQSDQ